jgi:hypothetical protein
MPHPPRHGLVGGLSLPNLLGMETPPMIDFGDTLSLLKQYGPLAVIVVFFFWQNWVREKKLLTRICKLEDEQRKVLLPLVAKCARVIAKNSLIMRRLEEAMNQHWTRKANCSLPGE